MTKSEWENVYSNLRQLRADFLISSTTYRNGKNKKIRDDAEKKVDNAIRLTRLSIQNNSDLAILFRESEFGQLNSSDEFFQARYFGGDMATFLSFIQAKIKSFDNAAGN